MIKTGNAVPLAADQMETFTGGAPFGAGIFLWLKNSPGFSLDKVTTPVQLDRSSTPLVKGRVRVRVPPLALD